MIRFLRRFDARSIRLLIFDLDGTLIDSRLDLIHSVNAMLRHFERPELEGDVIASYVGDGAPALVRRALAGRNGEAGGNGESGKDEALFHSALEYFLGYYRLHKLDHTTVYDGIPETLAALAAGAGRSVRPTLSTPAPTANAAATAKAADEGVRATRVMAVLSNKPVRPSQDIVQALGLGDYFVRVYGGNSFAYEKAGSAGGADSVARDGCRGGRDADDWGFVD